MFDKPLIHAENASRVKIGGSMQNSSSQFELTCIFCTFLIICMDSPLFLIHWFSWPGCALFSSVGWSNSITGRKLSVNQYGTNRLEHKGDMSSFVLRLGKHWLHKGDMGDIAALCSLSFLLTVDMLSLCSETRNEQRCCCVQSYFQFLAFIPLNRRNNNCCAYGLHTVKHLIIFRERN